MKNNNKILLLLFFFLCFGQSFAQVLTLDTILSRIEKYNPMLKMYDEQINGINNYSQMTKSWMPPKISTGLWQTPYSSFGNGMWMITAEQMIPNFGKQKANYDYMQGMVPVEQQGKSAKKNEMFAIAKQNYYEWIILKKKYELLLQVDSLLNYIIRVGQIRYSYNKEKLGTVYKAQADLYGVRTMETMVLGEIKMKNVELNTLMNASMSDVFDIDTFVQTHKYELRSIDSSVIASSRSDIKRFDASIGLIRLQQEYEKSKRLPDFGVSVSHMQSMGEMPNQFSVMGMISIPFAPWSSLEYESNIKGMDNTLRAINFEKQALINESAGMIVGIQTQIVTIKKLLANYSENIIPAYYRSYQSSLVAYEQNTEELFVVLDALRMYRMTKIDELELLNTLFQLQVSYEKEMEIR